MKSSSATSSPVAPPPPPPPPPPQLELDEEMKLMAKEAEALAPKKMDFRDMFALFHNTSGLDASAQGRAWESLWTATLAEAQEEHRLQRKLGHRGAADDTSRGGRNASSSGVEPPKRPRQPSPADTEPNKLSRGPNRGLNRPKGGASKLLQKLGARGT